MAEKKKSIIKKDKEKIKEQKKGRLDRAIHQRLYLVDRDDRDFQKMEFVVLGASGNPYYVTISAHPKCTCMDFRIRKNFCKHILVMGLKTNNPIINSKSISSQKLKNLQSKLPVIKNTIIAEKAVLKAYQQYSGSEKQVNLTQPLSKDELESKNARPISDFDECPICFEEMKEEATVFCRYGCGNNIHSDCFEKWKQNQIKQALEVSCVYCRTPWEPVMETHIKRKRIPNLSRFQKKPKNE